MASWQILALIVVSLSISTASNLPLLNTSTLLKGISDIPHFILFFKGEKEAVVPDRWGTNVNGRSVRYGK